MAGVVHESEQTDNNRMRRHTETELEIFNKFVRYLCLIGLATKLGERQLLVRGAWRFKPGALLLADEMATN